MLLLFPVFFFFFNDTATTEIYTLSLHDALPISNSRACRAISCTTSGVPTAAVVPLGARRRVRVTHRSEEHTSELQSQSNLVCRLLLEKKKKRETTNQICAVDTSDTSATRSLSP